MQGKDQAAEHGIASSGCGTGLTPSENTRETIALEQTHIAVGLNLPSEDLLLLRKRCQRVHRIEEAVTPWYYTIRCVSELLQRGVEQLPSDTMQSNLWLLSHAFGI